MEKRKLSNRRFGQLQAVWELLNDENKLYRPILRAGLLAGIILLYVGVIGMLESFSEREVIRRTLTLAQLLIVAPAIVASYRVARKVNEQHNLPLAIVSGGLVGLLTTV